MVGVGSGREELPVSASGSLVSAVGWKRCIGVKFQVGPCLYLPAHRFHSPPTYSLWPQCCSGVPKKGRNGWLQHCRVTWMFSRYFLASFCWTSHDDGDADGKYYRVTAMNHLGHLQASPHTVERHVYVLGESFWDMY